ncbi:MAG TPA: hypothetical protein PLL71_02920, partial [Agriterribacter sp.]|nr:hypothetical protein [Agriterribacter sp.]
MKKFYLLSIASFLFFGNKVHSQGEYQYPCGKYFFDIQTPEMGIWDKCRMGSFTLSAWFQLRENVWEGKAMHIFHRESYPPGKVEGASLYIDGDGIVKFKTWII